MKAILEIDADAIGQACKRLTGEIVAAHGATEQLIIVSIANGGRVLGQRLARDVGQQLKRDIPLGNVNITFHRDDIGTNPIPQEKGRTDIPVDVSGYTVILVDDVIASGRTVRAALNELFDNGRPEDVELAVLCDRGGRRLPIEPNYMGFDVDANEEHKVRATLSLEQPANDRLAVVQP